MIGFPMMFCQFDAHKGTQEVSIDTCGHFQYVCVPWTCNFDQQKKFSNQTLGGKKFFESWFVLQGCFASLMPTKALRSSQKTLMDTSIMFVCLRHMNFTHKRSSLTKPWEEKSSLRHNWFSTDVLPVWCPQKYSEGLKRHSSTLQTCFCALDTWIRPTEQVLQPSLGKKKDLSGMIGFPTMFCHFDSHKGPQEVSKDTHGHLQYVSVPWTCNFDQQKKLSKQT